MDKQWTSNGQLCVCVCVCGRRHGHGPGCGHGGRHERSSGTKSDRKGRGRESARAILPQKEAMSGGFEQRVLLRRRFPHCLNRREFQHRQVDLRRISSARRAWAPYELAWKSLREMVMSKKSRESTCARTRARLSGRARRWISRGNGARDGVQPGDRAGLVAALV